MTQINLEEQAPFLYRRLLSLMSTAEVWSDDTVIETKRHVRQLRNVKVYINSDEEPPPHFHIKYAEVSAKFSIKDCKLLKGKPGRREHKIVERWHDKYGKEILIKMWNESRPTDCQVGSI